MRKVIWLLVFGAVAIVLVLGIPVDALLFVRSPHRSPAVCFSQDY